MVNNLNIEELLIQANPVLEPEELRLLPAEVDARCASILERRGAMQTQTQTRRDAASPPPRRWRKPALAFVISLLVVLVAAGGVALLVGGVDPEVTEEPTVTTQAPAPTTTTPSITTTSSTSTSVPTTSTTVTARSQLAPPTPFTPPEIYPPEGLSLMVVGVAHDGALNVREEPGLTPIVTTLGSLDEVRSRGEGRELETTTWWKVVDEADDSIDGTTGWVNASYLASSVSARVDLTSHVEGEHGGSPAAATMADLGRIVAETLVNEEYPSRVAMVVAPAFSDPGFATFDVVSEDPLGLRVALRNVDSGIGGQNVWRFSVRSTLENGMFLLESVEGQGLIHACACWLP